MPQRQLAIVLALIAATLAALFLYLRSTAEPPRRAPAVVARRVAIRSLAYPDTRNGNRLDVQAAVDAEARYRG
jgi:hypothetical protein